MKSKAIKVYSEEEILNKWRTTDLNTREKMCVYISNPFCARKCKFCHYNSYLVTAEEYNKYYNEFLPNQLMKFKDILQNANVDYLYFGGGTSSIMTPKILSTTLSLIPNCKDMKYKCFEAHPVSLTKEKLDILANYNFNHLSLGVQTFDTDELKAQNRLNAPVEKIVELVRYAQSKGIQVNLDLMAYLNEDVDKDIERLCKDIKFSLTEVKPDLLDIYPMTEKVLNCHFMNCGRYYNPTEIQPELDKSVKLYRGLLKATRPFKADYTLQYGDRNLSDLDSILRNADWNYRIIKNGVNLLYRYDCTSRPNLTNSQNVIAFGGYKSHIAYSYMGTDFYYETKNDDNILSNAKYVQYPIK